MQHAAVPFAVAGRSTARRAVRTILALTLVLAALAGVLAASTARASAATVNPTMEWQFLSMLNSYRSQHHLAGLTMSSSMTGIARPWAAHMAAAQSLQHNPNVGVQIPQAVPSWRALGENIGIGYSVSTLNTAFINSAPHRANMLSSSYNYVGIGVYTVGTQIWVTVDFVGTPTSLARESAPVVITAGAPAVETDFTGSGRADTAIYRPAGNSWFVPGQSAVQWGQPGDVPVPGHYDGAAASKPAIFRPSTGQWWRRGLPVVTWGQAGDIPVPGDYNGDGKTDIAVYRPSTQTWYVLGQAAVHFGAPGDIPVPGTYLGGRTDLIAVWRPSTGVWYVAGSGTVRFGVRGDVPVPGQYGGGATLPAVYRPSTRTFWIAGQGAYPFGLAGDVPVPAQYLGGAITRIAVWRPSDGTWWVRGGAATAYGVRGDKPLH